MDAEVSNPEGSSDDENLENQYDDSFEENNKDLIEQEESQEDEENQKIYAWGSHKEQFYQSDEQVD